MTGDTGALIWERTRTFSLKNWPFAVLMLLLAGVAATPFVMMEKPLGAVILGGVVLALAPLFYVIEFATGPHLDAVYERGVRWNRGTREGFVEWNRLTFDSKIEQGEDGDIVREWFNVDGEADVSVIKIMGLSRDARDLMRERLKLP